MHHPRGRRSRPPAHRGACPPPGQQPAASQRAARAAPWDQAKDAASFFEQLWDGLVTVVAQEDDAWVHVGADGSVTAFTGKVEAGQGTRTALGLVVAEELAVPAASVRVGMGNTHVSPFDLGTFRTP